MILSSTLFSQKRKLIIKDNEAINVSKDLQMKKNLILTFNRQLESLGYRFSEALIQKLLSLDLETLKDYLMTEHRFILNELGVRNLQQAFFPGFPDELLKVDEMTLYEEALYHYFTCGEYRPNQTSDIFSYPLVDFSPLKVIDLGTKDDLIQLYKEMCVSEVGINSSDKEFVSHFVEKYPNEAIIYIPHELPHRETACFICSLFINQEDFPFERYLTNATEVLRLATILSGGDVYLKRACKLKSFKRRERRLFMKLLSLVKHDIKEELWLRREHWLRFSERVHPLEFKQYPELQKVFLNLHQKENKPMTFNSQLAQALEQENLQMAVELLSTRPVLFARHLDQLLRLEQKCSANTWLVRPSLVKPVFEELVFELPLKILLTLKSHFERRVESQEFRAFFPQGSIAKCFGTYDSNLPAFPDCVIQSVLGTIDYAIEVQLSQKEPMGKVFLDESLKQYAIPFSQRNSSKALQTIGRYSRLSFEGVSHLRPFLYWQQANGERCDLDLSALLFNESFELIHTIYYGELRGLGMVHSGDFVSAKEGAAEYIDIDLEEVSQHGRYLVIMVNSFTCTPFNELPDCFAGFMVRDGFSGETFEPKTVKQKFDLTTDDQVCVPVIFDLQTHEAIWVDLSLSHTGALNNAVSKETGAHYLLRAMIETRKETLYDLFSYHIKARKGELVETEAEAEVVFGGETGLQPWDYNEILANYLS